MASADAVAQCHVPATLGAMMMMRVIEPVGGQPHTRLAAALRGPWARAPLSRAHNLLPELPARREEAREVDGRRRGGRHAGGRTALPTASLCRRVSRAAVETAVSRQHLQERAALHNCGRIRAQGHSGRRRN
eukprot:2829834-Rhodomonas_salina.1